jgi:hypothetical protein
MMKLGIGNDFPKPLPPYPMSDTAWKRQDTYRDAKRSCAEFYEELNALLFAIIKSTVAAAFNPTLNRTEGDGISVLKNIHTFVPIGEYNFVLGIEKKLQALSVRDHESPARVFDEANKLFSELVGSTATIDDKKRIAGDDNFTKLVINVWFSQCARWSPHMMAHRETMLKMNRDELHEYMIETYAVHFRKLDDDKPASSRNKDRGSRVSQQASTSGQCTNCGRDHDFSHCRLEGGGAEIYCDFCSRYGHGSKAFPCTNPKNPAAKNGKGSGKGSGKGGKGGKGNNSADQKKKTCTHCKKDGHTWEHCFTRFEEVLKDKANKAKSKKDKAARASQQTTTPTSDTDKNGDHE